MTQIRQPFKSFRPVLAFDLLTETCSILAKHCPPPVSSIIANMVQSSNKFSCERSIYTRTRAVMKACTVVTRGLQPL